MTNTDITTTNSVEEGIMNLMRTGNHDKEALAVIKSGIKRNRNYVNSEGKSLLSYALEFETMDILETILEEKEENLKEEDRLNVNMLLFNPDDKEKKFGGFTALMLAFRAKQPSTAIVLLRDPRFDPNAQSTGGLATGSAITIISCLLNHRSADLINFLVESNRELIPTEKELKEIKRLINFAEDGSEWKATLEALLNNIERDANTRTCAKMMSLKRQYEQEDREESQAPMGLGLRPLAPEAMGLTGEPATKKTKTEQEE